MGIFFVNVLDSETEDLINLAKKIWNENYIGIISKDQIDYMIQTMYNPQIIVKQIKQGNYLWIQNKENQKIGFTYFHKKTKENTLFLSKLYIDSFFHSQGFGKKSLEYIMQFAKQNNYEKIELLVNKNNLKAIRAYKNFGFKIIEDKITQIGKEYIMDDYLCEYKIN